MSLDAQIQAGFTAVGNVVKTKISASEKGVANGVATLDGAGKLTASQLPASAVGGLSYKGVWDASTNTPAIPAASAGNKGHYYKVSVAGATIVDTINDWKVGDWIASNGSTWDKIDNTDAVSSVAGRTGAVVLATSDIAGLDTALGTIVTTNATTSTAGLMSSTDKTKLDGVATNANNYAHPTGDGNLHVPATSTTNNGKFLKAGATAGSIAWATLATSDVTGLDTTLSGKANSSALITLSASVGATDTDYVAVFNAALV